MMRAAVIVVLNLAACSSGARTTPTNVPPDRTAEIDAGVPPGPLPATCPPAFNQAGGTCDAKVATETCNYPEGTCYCGVQWPCSGVARSDEEVASWPTSWQCTAKPPLVRPDGCPGSMPGDGVACAPDGKVCSWGDCCFHQMTCVKGGWKMTGGGCPP